MLGWINKLHKIPTYYLLLGSTYPIFRGLKMLKSQYFIPVLSDSIWSAVEFVQYTLFSWHKEIASLQLSDTYIINGIGKQVTKRTRFQNLLEEKNKYIARCCGLKFNILLSKRFSMKDHQFHHFIWTKIIIVRLLDTNSQLSKLECI